MRNILIIISFLFGMIILPATAQEKAQLPAQTELQAELQKAEKAYNRAKDAYKNALKAQKEEARKKMRDAGHEVGRIRMEMFLIQKREYLREKAALTEKECKVFFPVYEELQGKLFHLQDDVQRSIKRLLRSKKEVRDEEYRQVVARKAEVAAQEAQLQKEYFERFLQILPAKKVVAVFDAEGRFSQEMMRRKGEGKQLPPPPPPHEKK